MRAPLAVLIALAAGCGGDRVFFDIDTSAVPGADKITGFTLILASPEVVAQRQRMHVGEANNTVLRDVYYVAQRHAFELRADEVEVEIAEPGFPYTPIVVAYEGAKIVAMGAVDADQLFPPDVEDDVGYPVPHVVPRADVTIFDVPLEPVDELVSEQSVYVFHNESVLAFRCPSRGAAAPPSALVWHRHSDRQLRIVLPGPGTLDAKDRLYADDGVDLDCDTYTPDQARRADSRDCDDLDDREFGVRQELCNGIDDDCDGRLGYVIVPCPNACGGVGVCDDEDPDDRDLRCPERDPEETCPSCEIVPVNGVSCTSRGLVPLPRCGKDCEVTLIAPADGRVHIGADEQQREGPGKTIKLEEGGPIHVFVDTPHPESFTLLVEPKDSDPYVHTRALTPATAILGAPCAEPIRCFPIAAPIGQLDALGATAEHPSATADLRELFFTRRVGDGTTHLMVSKRSSPTHPWGVPEPVFTAASDSTDRAPSISADGLVLLFASRRDPNNSIDVYRVTRQTRAAPWSVPTPVPELSSTDLDETSAIELTTGSSTRYVFTARGADDQSEIRIIARAGQLSTPLVTSITSNNANPWVTEGFAALYFDSDRANDNTDLFRAALTTTADNATAGAAEQLHWLNSTARDFAPWVSPDGKTILFTSERGTGGARIFEARWP